MLKKLEFFLKIPLCGINFDKKPIQEYQVDNSHLKNSQKRKCDYRVNRFSFVLLLMSFILYNIILPINY
jgi:hypothetical protein